MTYAEAIDKMIHWRNAERILLWVGLLWPLLLFVLQPAPILMAWVALLVLFLFVHHKRKTYRNIARSLHDEEDY